MIKGQKYVISHRSIFTGTYNENVKKVPLYFCLLSVPYFHKRYSSTVTYNEKMNKNTMIVLLITCSIFL